MRVSIKKINFSVSFNYEAYSSIGFGNGDIKITVSLKKQKDVLSERHIRAITIFFSSGPRAFDTGKRIR